MVNQNATTDKLVSCCSRGKEGGVMEILNDGDSNPYDINGVSSTGYTAMHLAAEENHLTIVKLLLKVHADSIDLNIRGGVFQNTPLHSAAYKGHYKVVALLTSAKTLLGTPLADTTVTNKFGETPLQTAVARKGKPGSLPGKVFNGLTKSIATLKKSEKQQAQPKKFTGGGYFGNVGWGGSAAPTSPPATSSTPSEGEKPDPKADAAKSSGNLAGDVSGETRENDGDQQDPWLSDRTLRDLETFSALLQPKSDQTGDPAAQAVKNVAATSAKTEPATVRATVPAPMPVIKEETPQQEQGPAQSAPTKEIQVEEKVEEPTEEDSAEESTFTALVSTVGMVVDVVVAAGAWSVRDSSNLPERRRARVADIWQALPKKTSREDHQLSDAALDDCWKAVLGDEVLAPLMSVNGDHAGEGKTILKALQGMRVLNEISQVVVVDGGDTGKRVSQTTFMKLCDQRLLTIARDAADMMPRT